MRCYAGLAVKYQHVEESGNLSTNDNWTGCSGIASGQSGENSGEFHAKNRAALLTVVAKNLPAMFLNDAVADAEPEPGSLAHWFGSVKRIEDAVGLADAGTVI